MRIPARCREWWGVENNRRHHQQQHCLLGYHAGSTTLVGHPTFLGYQSFHQPKQHRFSSSRCDMEDDDHMKFMESMMEDARHDFWAIPIEMCLNPFTTNRLDVGYEKIPKTC